MSFWSKKQVLDFQAVTNKNYIFDKSGTSKCVQANSTQVPCTDDDTHTFMLPYFNGNCHINQPTNQHVESPLSLTKTSPTLITTKQDKKKGSKFTKSQQTKEGNKHQKT